MYDISLRPERDEFSTDSMKYGAGPAAMPTEILEKGAAVRISWLIFPSRNSIFKPEIKYGLFGSLDLFLN